MRLRVLVYLGSSVLLLALEIWHPGFVTRPRWVVGLMVCSFFFGTLLATYGSIKDRAHHRWLLFGYAAANAWLIIYFARVYVIYGLDCAGRVAPDYALALYFSVVTWTTLGYGDCHPLPDYRLITASEAMLGYIYLGIFVGLLAKVFDEKR